MPEQPDHEVFDVLAIANIEEQFAKELVPEFMMYWRDKNELHHSWKSYYDDGSIKCKAVYNKGKKVGIWHYYYRNEKAKRVTYEDNRVVKVEVIDPDKE